MTRDELIQTLRKVAVCGGPDNALAERVCLHLPFKKMVRLHARFEDTDPLTFATEFLKCFFGHLGQYGVSYAIEAEPSNHGEAVIDDLCTKSQESDLKRQERFWRTEFNRLQGLRKIFAMMHERELLTGPDFAIPIQYLFDIFLAEPVWFMGGKEGSAEGRKNFFANLLTESQGHLFEVYNHDSRPLAAFDGLETVPPEIMEVMAEAKNVFDYVVITTPYHDIASRMWRDTRDLARNADPEVFGFIADKPFIIRLGRWSKTGLLARKCDQIAATIWHTARSINLIDEFFEAIHAYRHNFDKFLCPLEKKPLEALVNILNSYLPPNQMVRPVATQSLVDRAVHFFDGFGILFQH